MTDSAALLQARAQLQFFELVQDDLPKVADMLAASMIDKGNQQATKLWADYTLGLPRNGEQRVKTLELLDEVVRHSDDETKALVRAEAAKVLLASTNPPARATELKARVYWLEHLDELVDRVVSTMFDDGGDEQAIRQWLDALGQYAKADAPAQLDQIKQLLTDAARRPEAEQTPARDFVRALLKFTLERA